MSSESQAISAAQFAEAIEDLPVENLYSKAYEIENSIAHLRRSNAQLQEYSDSIKNDTTLDQSVRSEGDRDCLEAISENEIVIERQQQRIDLLRREVERRGGRWHEGDTATEPTINGASGLSHHNIESSASNTSRPRLTDEELRRRLEEQMGSNDSDDEEGMHL